MLNNYQLSSYKVPKFSEPDCRAPAKTGPCKAHILRYYYDAEDGQCKRFVYGGCGGNSNNFLTVRECQRKCQEKQTGLLEKDSQTPNDFDYTTDPPRRDAPIIYHFTCILDSIYAHPGDCGKYVVCDHKIPHVMDCPKGLHYNPKVKRCEWQCEAHCNATLACECGWPECKKSDKKSDQVTEGFECPSNNGKYGHFLDCLSYYHCKRGVPTLKKCPKGTAFDRNKSKCVTEHEATCVYQCEERDAAYPHDEDCHKFIDCVNGVSKVERCPPGKAFDPEQRNCIDERQVSACAWSE